MDIVIGWLDYVCQYLAIFNNEILSTAQRPSTPAKRC